MGMALLAAFLLLIGAMALAWIVQRKTGNSGWIDTIWAISVGLAAITALMLVPADAARRILMLVLIALWSARLGAHIFTRTHRTQDDPRYAALIAGWGRGAPLRLFVFLQLQALAGLVLVLAITLAGVSAAPVTSWGTTGFAALALVAAVGEAKADSQLRAFKRSGPPDRVCDTGLWAYSRHPNYFFEWLYWLAIAMIAVTPPTGATGLAALAAPVMMYLLLRHGSGVPHIEKHMQLTRPDAFAAYARRVPMFFPRVW